MYLVLLMLALVNPFAQAETILGVYIFSRHGDRTAKATPPLNLTDLGYEEVFTSGTYFRNRYVASDASNRIAGISSDLVALSEVMASAPADNVLMSSAVGFTQGLYPPVGTTLGEQTLRNGTKVEAPLNGYQIIPIATVGNGLGSNQENTAFLQSQSNCSNAIASSNEYLTTSEYLELLASTKNFFSSLEPLINGTFNLSQASFQNAYTSKLIPYRGLGYLHAETSLSVFDLLNVAEIDNTTFDPTNTLTATVLFQARTLADNHEFNLAYNSSAPIRAVAGSILAGQIIAALNDTITSAGGLKLQVQFGAYASFLSFFGLAGLTEASPNFFGIPDYASTMTFELFSNESAVSSFVPISELNVRFLFHNGTTSSSSQPVAFALFNQSSTVLSWTDFLNGMNKFAIGSESQFCSECGNTNGVCAS